MLLKKEEPCMNSFKIFKPRRPYANQHPKIKKVYLDIIDMDKEYQKDIDSGKGFLITNEEDFDERKGVRTIDGKFSPLFGADAFSDKSSDDLYHCECGNLIGAVYEGDTCPQCHTQVQFVNADLTITGYIPLGDHCVINPAIYQFLEKLIGKKEIVNIIKFNNRFNVDGKNVSTKTKASPFHGIGMTAFKENFDEICEFYKEKRKKYDKDYDLIMKYKDRAFAHYIPVYSSALRPLIKENSKMGVFKVNKSYAIILANANTIRMINPIGIDRTIVNENCLYEIQEEVLSIYNESVEVNMSGKNGIPRGQIITSRNNYTFRCVIAPAIGHAVNEVSLPYIIGMECMRPLLIYQLTNLGNMNVRDANMKIDAALRKPDKRLWILANYIIQRSKNPPMVMVQRSPSLLQESMRLMNIKQIKADIEDLTMNVPVGILDGMNGDFDGDTYAGYFIYDNNLKEVWGNVHCPDCHFISRHTGQYNGLCGFIKDNSVSLSEIWEIGKNSIYYDTYASESERTKHMMGW